MLFFFATSTWLKHRTVKTYLSGLHYAQIYRDGNPFLTDMRELEYMLVGVKREEASRGVTPKPWLKIMAEILKQV